MLQPGCLEGLDVRLAGSHLLINNSLTFGSDHRWASPPREQAALQLLLNMLPNGPCGCSLDIQVPVLGFSFQCSDVRYAKQCVSEKGWEEMLSFPSLLQLPALAVSRPISV